MKRRYRAQSMLEYVLLLTLIAVLAFQAFRPGGVISQVHNRSVNIFQEGAVSIIGND